MKYSTQMLDLKINYFIQFKLMSHYIVINILLILNMNKIQLYNYNLFK